MTLYTSVGQAQALDGREAGLQAANQALNQLGTNSIVFGIVIASHHYDAQLVVSGITSLTGNVPLIGFGTTGAFSGIKADQHSVVVALFGGDDIEVESHWFGAYAQSSSETAERLVRLARFDKSPARSMLVFADGFNGDAEEFCAGLPAEFPIMGALASGDLRSGTSYQIAGAQTGTSGLIIAILRGLIKTSVGYAHGWTPVGTRYRVTRSRGFWLRTLDGKPASETYASMFGYPARDWAFPPLNALTRVYPLGVEQGPGRDLLVRSPLRVEADGSFRMNTQIRDGSDAYLLIGSPTSCKESARKAAKEALTAFAGKPKFALVLVDTAWQMLMQADQGAEIEAIKEVLGDDVLIAGGYTLGQIVPAREDETAPKFLNQHIVVVLFGEANA